MLATFPNQAPPPPTLAFAQATARSRRLNGPFTAAARLSGQVPNQEASRWTRTARRSSPDGSCDSRSARSSGPLQRPCHRRQRRAAAGRRPASNRGRISSPPRRAPPADPRQRGQFAAPPPMTQHPGHSTSLVQLTARTAIRQVRAVNGSRRSSPAIPRLHRHDGPISATPLHRHSPAPPSRIPPCQHRWPGRQHRTVCYWGAAGRRKLGSRVTASCRERTMHPGHQTGTGRAAPRRDG